MSILVRPLAEADYAAVVALKNQCQHPPLDVETKADFVQTFPAHYPVVHLVAEAGGKVAGYAVAYQASWIKADRMQTHLVVDGALRGQGVATALSEAFMPFVREHRPAKLQTMVQDHDQDSLAWAERRGFVREHHFFDSVLKLTEFDPAPFAGHVERVEAMGYRFVPFARLQTPETERQLYDFHHELITDMPNGTDVARAAFEDWCGWLIKGFDAWTEATIIALDPDGRWAGFAGVKRTGNQAKIAFTGVRRDCRGAGVALALKLKGLEVMRAAGVAEVSTVNHAANGPMLAVNRRLGYQSLPGHYVMVKTL